MILLVLDRENIPKYSMVVVSRAGKSHERGGGLC